MSNELYCQYVSSRGIAYSCDIYPQKVVSDTLKLPLSTYKDIKDNDSVYVISSALKIFVEMILPKKSVGKKPPFDINVMLILRELKSLIPEILNNKNNPKLKMQ